MPDDPAAQAAEAPSQRIAAGLDPRRRIYRNRFNEYFVFLLSSVGAAVAVPLLLLLVQAFAGRFDLYTYLLASVALEWFLIFGIGRPAMKPIERVGWAALWGFGAALFGLLFYYLVVDNIL